MKKRYYDRNYLNRIPIRSDNIDINVDMSGNIVLCSVNQGFMNKLVQVILRKPKFSYIHLDEIGSTVWKNIDGKRDIVFIGEILKEEFGEKIEPLYDRLVSYFDYLFKSGLITFKKAETVK